MNSFTIYGRRNNRATNFNINISTLLLIFLIFQRSYDDDPVLEDRLAKPTTLNPILAASLIKSLLCRLKGFKVVSINLTAHASLGIVMMLDRVFVLHTHNIPPASNIVNKSLDSI
jgi:hypothetical protein